MPGCVECRPTGNGGWIRHESCSSHKQRRPAWGEVDAREQNGNSEAQCNGNGTKVDGASQATGTDAKIGNQPINKYFCNLMNAMGVKAGDDGFPKVGGAAEVTHFGMYDTTEDFIGGGTKPARIANPEGFAALKAGS